MMGFRPVLTPASSAPAPLLTFNQRRKKKDKVVIKFDPDARKEYLTGFHKRKQKRREEAKEQLAKKARQEKIQERKEKKEAEVSLIEERKQLQDAGFITRDGPQPKRQRDPGEDERLEEEKQQVVKSFKDLLDETDATLANKARKIEKRNAKLNAEEGAENQDEDNGEDEEQEEEEESEEEEEESEEEEGSGKTLEFQGRQTYTTVTVSTYDDDDEPPQGDEDEDEEEEETPQTKKGGNNSTSTNNTQKNTNTPTRDNKQSPRRSWNAKGNTDGEGEGPKTKWQLRADPKKGAKKVVDFSEERAGKRKRGSGSSGGGPQKKSKWSKTEQFKAKRKNKKKPSKGRK